METRIPPDLVGSHQISKIWWEIPTIFLKSGGNLVSSHHGLLSILSPDYMGSLMIFMSILGVGGLNMCKKVKITICVQFSIFYHKY